jgi:hypothetical protein
VNFSTITISEQEAEEKEEQLNHAPSFPVSYLCHSQSFNCKLYNPLQDLANKGSSDHRIVYKWQYGSHTDVYKWQYGSQVALKEPCASKYIAEFRMMYS